MPRNFNTRTGRDRGVRVQLDETFEMEFGKADRGVKAKRRVNGRIAFPRFGGNAKAGDIWQVRIPSGERYQNDAGSVYFLELVKRVSTAAERKAAHEAKSDRWNELKPQVQAWLDKFTGWSTKPHVFTLEGEDLTLTIEVKNFSAQMKGLEVSIAPKIQFQDWNRQFNEVEVSVAWSELKVTRVYLRQPGRYNQVAAEVKSKLGQHDAVFFAPHTGEVKFLRWEREEQAVQAHFSLKLGEVQKEVAITVVDFHVDAGKGQVRHFISERDQKDKIQVEHYLPEIPQAELDWLTSLEAAHTAYGQQMQSTGLLAIDDDSVGYKLQDFLKELEYGGLGWSPWGSNGNFVIHPSMQPLLEGLPVELAPAEMKSGSPEHAWHAITWECGIEPHAAEVITTLAAETTEKVENLDLQAWLESLGQDAKVPCLITCTEQEGEGDKFVFTATVQAPQTVEIYRKHDFGAFRGETGWGVQPAQRVVIEDRPYTFEHLATGNAHFEGESTLKVHYIRSGKRSRWIVSWSAPETQDEETSRKIEAIRSLVEFAKKYPVILTGWRYVNNGNPVVFVRYSEETWELREFNRDTYQVQKRKGYGSNKVVLYADPSVRGVDRALKAYRDEWGWDVGADEGWEQAATQNILSLFPPELIVKLGGE